MPRKARMLSQSGIYHVVFKGINHEPVFGTKNEKKKLKAVMKRKMKEHRVEVYAYCIMDTHVHLMIRGEMQEISKFVTKCEIVYASEYNLKHNRNGHVFQNRFYSDGIETQQRFWNCINYIHNNPIKAKIVELPELYEFSSYQEYVKGQTNLVTQKVLLLIRNKFKEMDEFEAFSHKNEQNSWYSGVEEEIELQKQELIEGRLDEFPEMSVFENRGGKVHNSELTRKMAQELKVTQAQIVREINKRIQETDE